MVQPTTSVPESNDLVLSKAETLPQHQTAVVMLENYTERRLGEQYRDRGTTWFVALRELGYKHIVFVQGNNVSDPDGLITLAEYFSMVRPLQTEPLICPVCMERLRVLARLPSLPVIA